jgi:integrative and conjugative element protein (TIGR02256 family)
MLQFRQDDDKATEAGGVIIGRHIAGSDDVVADLVTSPMRGDRRSRTHFFRSARGHQAQLDSAWLRSEGTQVYLGEWHTHPEGHPTPSGIDFGDWSRRLMLDTVEARFVYFLIVGQIEVCAWEGDRDSLHIVKLVARTGAAHGEFG